VPSNVASPVPSNVASPVPSNVVSVLGSAAVFSVVGSSVAVVAGELSDVSSLTRGFVRLVACSSPDSEGLVVDSAAARGSSGSGPVSRCGIRVSESGGASGSRDSTDAAVVWDVFCPAVKVASHVGH
jgi:hypothetical protein